MKACASSFVVEFFRLGVMQASLPFASLALAIEGAKKRTKGKELLSGWVFAIFTTEEGVKSMVRIALVSEGRLDPR